MTVHSTEFFSKQTPPTDLGLSDQALGVLFSMKKGETSDTALSTQDGFLLARVTDVQPAGFTPLDAVKNVIKDRLVAEEALKLARAKAEETAKTMQQTDQVREFLTGNLLNTLLDASSLIVFLPVLYLYSPRLTMPTPAAPFIGSVWPPSATSPGRPFPSMLSPACP